MLCRTYLLSCEVITGWPLEKQNMDFSKTKQYVAFMVAEKNLAWWAIVSFMEC